MLLRWANPSASFMPQQACSGIHPPHPYDLATETRLPRHHSLSGDKEDYTHTHTRLVTIATWVLLLLLPTPVPRVLTRIGCPTAFCLADFTDQKYAVLQGAGPASNVSFKMQCRSV